ncbi:unnamed protein product [Musa acuminata var. zebrina]
MMNQTAVNGGNGAKPHFVLVPFLEQGHIIPMVDMAHVLAGRGAHVSFLTTRLNALRIKLIIERAEESRLPIEFVALCFPCAEVGLPEGTENADALPSQDHLDTFLRACAMLREPLTSHLRRHHLPPSCVISDAFYTWTGDMARELGVPRLVFNGYGCFTLLARYILHRENVYEQGIDESQMLDLPGFPHRLQISKAQAPGNFMGPRLQRFRCEVMEEESRADGVVVNTFDDIEAPYVESYQKAMGKRVWTIGPLLRLCGGDATHMAARGNKAAIDGNECIRWLDSMKPSSVIYVSFGSLVSSTLQQIIEIGMGLETSGSPFIWVIRSGKQAAEVERWLSEEFEERVGSRGLVIRGWAPQMVILSHPAVGGFVTHCGWNSILEGMSAGLPMVTWPNFGDQFLNQKLVVQVLRVGVAVGVENSDVLVKREEVEKAVSELMGGGEEGEARRKRSRELKDSAKRAAERGGSSHDNIGMLIRQIQGSSIDGCAM